MKEEIKYTKKQITEALQHWNKLLEQTEEYDSTDGGVPEDLIWNAENCLTEIAATLDSNPKLSHLSPQLKKIIEDFQKFEDDLEQQNGSVSDSRNFEIPPGEEENLPF